ncbi:type II inositol polyphosphate 5-phosphatase 14-like [Agrilus planipennis]|uniref:Type II inositol polyphosphate 5-phosphatase 14-like n=1 Tax=Agrilus planipennis TaxID=224129 RepID=A0A1W4XIM9_AGRPL|nr:type II inositol polyphosphate 5-phosphatase 14-like [Agrilus planipennis]
MPFAVRTRADDGDKHTSDVNALIFANNKLYSGANDGKIKVWEEDLKLGGQVDAHTAVYSLAASNDTLYSCSNDGFIKAWLLDSLKEKGTIYKGEDEFWKLVYVDGTLYAGDSQGQIRFFQNDKIVNNLGVLEGVSGLGVQGNLLFSVKELDVVVTEFIPGHQGQFTTETTIMGRAPLIVEDGKFAFVSRSGRDLLVHNACKKSGFNLIAEVKDAHEKIINALVAVKDGSDLLLYTGGWDKTVKQWKLSGKNLSLVNQCNADFVVNVLAAGPKGEIYAGGSDGHILRIDV